jgi:hypothetical protein
MSENNAATPLLGSLETICSVRRTRGGVAEIVTHRGEMHDDPMVYAVKDRVSAICLLLVVAFVVAGTFL